MPRTHTVIIGAGHAGLAMSRCLADRDVDHVVLDRGCVGERWRTARWDSFRLLTPNWLSRLPGWRYGGTDPDGFMNSSEFMEYLSGYARSFDAPVQPHTDVLRVDQDATRFTVQTSRGAWEARNVVIATGYHSHPKVPALAAGLSGTIAQVTTSTYRSPSNLPDGAVLVVGASASGTQLAHELNAAGRRVILAVGCHTRLPRRYRGRDILWWLDRMGRFDRVIDAEAGSEAALAEPSLQLRGTSDPRGNDLGVLQDVGVQLTGRLSTLSAHVAEFADDLDVSVGSAQRRLDRVLGEIDRYGDATPGAALGPPDPPPLITVPAGLSKVDLRPAGVSTVVWATGYQPEYPWLAVPVIDDAGRIRHRRGVTEVAGLYAIGLRLQHRRNSTFIDGARHDAAYLAEHIAAGRANATQAATQAGAQTAPQTAPAGV